MSKERRLRVMVLIDTLAAGGAERVAVELACALDTSRFDPHVVVTKRGGPLEASLDAKGVAYTILGRRHLVSPRAFVRALHHARTSDLIHSHLFGNNAWGAVLAGLVRRPLIAHEHNRVGPHVRFEGLIDRFVIGRAAARILCVSDSAARQLVTAGLSRSQLQVVPNGVVIDRHPLDRRAARARLGLRAEDVVVGVVGSLRPEKGHDLLLRAFTTIVRAGRHPSVRLCIVGDGSCRTMLEQLASELDVVHRVEFAGERVDAPRLQAAFDVSVLPSRSEGLPLAALEALATGTPVVATRIGGLPSLLSGGAGVLVEPGDETALAAGIVAVIDDQALARRLAGEGLKRVTEHHDLAEITATVEAVYRRVLAPSFEEPCSGGEDVAVRVAEGVG